MFLSVLRQGLLLPLAVAFCWSGSGCGRVGYELLSLQGSGGGDSGGTESGGASTTGGRDAGASGASGVGSTPAAPGGAAATGGAGAGGGPVEAGPESGVGGAGAGGSVEAGPDAPACVPTAAAPDYCATLPRLCSPPVIDGVLDPGAPLLDVLPLGWNNTATPLPAESAARYGAAWRDDGVYVFVEVTDATRLPPRVGDEVWRGDGVEIYVDADGTFTAPPAFDNPGTRQIQAAAPVDGTTSGARGEVFTWGFAGTRVPWTSNFIVVPTPSGYIVEAFITVTEMALPAWSLTAGAVVGFDLGVNVSDADASTYQAPDGHRLGQYFLRLAGTTPPFFDVRAFCLPVLAP